MTDDLHSPYFRNEDGFWEDFHRFNALFEPWRWNTPNARKNHEDEFGALIEGGEGYFSRDHGPAWGDQFKLSRRSMETILMIVLWGNGRGKAICEALQEQDMDRVRQAQNRLADIAGLNMKPEASQAGEPESIPQPLPKKGRSK